MNANYRNNIMAGVAFFLSLALTTTAQAGPKVDAANVWLRGGELELAYANQVDESVGIVDEEIRTEPLPELERALRVHVWHGRDDDDAYSKGELLDLHFRTNEDAYVVVYRIDAEGYVEVLWPSTRYDDGFAYAGHSYGLPPRDGGQRLRVSNKKGVEYIQAIASAYPFDLRDLAIDFAFDRGERERFDYVVAGDPFLAVNEINYAITGLEEDADYVVTDWTHLYVESQVEHARYSCTQCHVDDDDYHPYVDNCSQVTIRYDFGWYDRWYTRYGWYPIYYDPLYVYWDSFYYRPYYNWYYPVSYRWPSYYWGVYYRPYRVYDWYDSDYYRGNHRRRYADGSSRVRPLYPDRGGSVSGRIRDVVRRDTAERGRRDVAQRERTREPVQNVASRVRGTRSERREEILRTQRSPRRGERGGAVRSPSSDRSRGRDRGRVVSLGPDGKSRERQPRVGADNRRGRDGRRWTRPVVRNIDRDDKSRSGVRSRSRSTDRDRERPTLRSRSRDDSRREVKRQPRIRSNDRERTKRQEPKRAPREIRKRDRKDKREGGGNRSGRVSRSSNRSSSRSPRATVKRATPRSSGSKSPARSSSRSGSVKSRDRSGSKSSASPRSSSRSSGRSGGSRSRGGSGRGGRG